MAQEEIADGWRRSHYGKSLNRWVMLAGDSVCQNRKNEEGDERMSKKTLCRLLLFIVLVGGLVAGCSGIKFTQGNWVVSIYMCGSDLESESGFASADLKALQSIPLPENVKFVIQTGGAKKWQTAGIPENELARYVYDSSGFHEIERLQDASMGDEETLEAFLRFSKERYPADHRMLVFWDHGGGSLGGCCFDEKYETTLSLNDLRQALQSVEENNPKKPAFELVLFDTCLMASIETANTLYGFARYMAASEELMPGTGTDYVGWAGALAKDPGMDGKKLGTVICETYLPHCERHEADDMATLSLIDLGQMPALNDAYEKMGQEALKLSQGNPRHFFTTYDRVAGGVENYGPNDSEDYTNMVDLGSLADGMAELSTAPAFVEALDKAVVCKTAGPYRKYGMGLSGYYSLYGGLDSWQIYSSLTGVSKAFAKLYHDMLSGSGDGTPWFYFDVEKIKHAHIVLNENNMATIALSPEDANAISQADFLLCSYDAQGREIYLGSDDKMKADWERGVFQENFDGKWPALNGHVLSFYLSEQQQDYNLYYSYILLNGQKCYLTAGYDFTKDEYEILSIHRVLKNGWMDRQNLNLKAGDQIIPLFFNDEGEEVKGTTFQLAGEPVLRDEPLANGTYAFAFRFTTARNESVVSETIHFVIQNGGMTVTK